MKIIIAPDKFKDSLSGFEFCNAVAEGISTVLPDTNLIKMPLADGGDGTLEVIRYYLGGKKIRLKVNDPLFRPIEAEYLLSEESQTAFIEMARASGLHLLKEKDRNCMLTTSYGTGELIADAIDKGAQNIILGVGGSATNDLGIGMTAALGYRFLDCNGNPVQLTGNNLHLIQRIDARKVYNKLKDTEFIIASDVQNSLYGKNGAAYIYAAQKGASAEEIRLLDQGLRHLSKIIKEQYHIDLQQIPGSGAAGGLGGGAVAFFNGKIEAGIEIIKKIADFDQQIKDANWIITGEGKFDRQTFSGKVITGVLKAALKQEIPVAVFCGINALRNNNLKEKGIHYCKAISENESSKKTAFKNAYRNLVKHSAEFAKKIQLLIL